MSKVLMDTNAYSLLLKGNTEVLDLISEATDVFMSVIVLGELFAGFQGGKFEKENIELLNKFLRKSTVSTVDVTRNTAEIFAEIKQNLKSRGKPIPINDVWIAAHASETGSIVVTFDKHFDLVEGLRVTCLDGGR